MRWLLELRNAEPSNLLESPGVRGLGFTAWCRFKVEVQFGVFRL